MCTGADSADEGWKREVWERNVQMGVMEHVVQIVLRCGIVRVHACAVGSKAPCFALLRSCRQRFLVWHLIVAVARQFARQTEF